MSNQADFEKEFSIWDAIPSEYLIRSSVQLVSDYQNMGFHLVQDEPIKGRYILRMLRVGLIKMTDRFVRTSARIDGLPFELRSFDQREMVDFRRAALSHCDDRLKLPERR